MQQSWLVLLPPLLVIICATYTHKTLQALVIGIVSAALIACDGSIVQAAHFIALRVWGVSELAKFSSFQAFKTGSNIFIILFLMVLGIFIVLIQRSGAAFAYSYAIASKLQSARSAQRSSLLLSTSLFIDDYFNCLTVGSVMRSLTDRFKVPRSLLGVLVNGIAAPLAVIIPLSSWMAEIVGQLRNSGVHTVVSNGTLILSDPLSCYINSIGFMFYAFIMIGALWMIASRESAYAIIARHQLVAKQTGNLFGGRTALQGESDLSVEHMHACVSDFIIPIISLFIAVIGWIGFDGGWLVLGGSNSFMQAIQGANVFSALFCGGVIALCITILFYLMRGLIAITSISSIMREGVSLMSGSLIMLILIWTMSALLSKDLATGSYLAGLVAGKLPLWALPAIFFMLAVSISTMMATSWGTIGILLPLGCRLVPALVGFAVPVDGAQIPMLFPVLGAIISGSIVGNHLSPVADVMVMSAASAGCYHDDLVKAQQSVSLPAVVASLISFITCGVIVVSTGKLFLGALIPLLLGLVINWTLQNIITKYSLS